MTGFKGLITAGLAGVMLGTVIVGALRTAPIWAARYDIRPPDNSPTLHRGTISPCRPTASDCVDPAAVTGPTLAMARLVAGVRERAGCTAPLTLDKHLVEVAQRQADALAAGAPMSHLDSQRRSPQDRASAAGYPWPVVETIGAGISDATTVVDVWLNPKVDPTITRRLSDCSTLELGVGWSGDSPGGAFGSGVWVLLQGHPPG